MRRRLTVFLLMLCTCWQALAYAGSAVMLADSDEFAHALMHFKGESHHHDEDEQGGIHLDDSLASVQHMMSDACVHAPGLPAVIDLPLPSLQLDTPVEATAASMPPPFLGGLERPPRLTA